MSKNKALDVIYDFNDIQLEITLDCFHYWAMEILKRIISIIISTTDVEKTLSIRNILRKYNGCCHPEDINRYYKSVYRKIKKLAECLEHNRAILEEIAEVLQIDSNVSVDVEFCIEEAIEWTLKSQ